MGRKSRTWTPSELARIGTISDGELAKELGIHLCTVGVKRRELGISAKPIKIDWPETIISRLGTVSDSVIAQELEISAVSVGAKRAELGIPALRKAAPYSDSEIALLGTEMDCVIAEKLGRTKQSVCQMRLKLGIPRARAKRLFDGPSWNSMAQIDQPIFYKTMADYYEQKNGEPLTYPKLSKICLWSVSRLQKWFTPGSAQEPLALPVRHHIWLSIIFLQNKDSQ